MRSINVLLSVLLCFWQTPVLAGPYAIKAEEVRVNTSGFSGNLDATKNDLQKVADALDDLDVAETDPVFTAWDKDYADIINTPDLSAYLTDAPTDDKTYGRLNGGWAEVTTTEIDPVYSEWIALNPTSGTNTGDQNDHGTLDGLSDDDHTQYALADGTRGDFLKLDQTTPQTITGGIPLLTGLTPTADYEIATKKYVDDEVGGIDLTPYAKLDGTNQPFTGDVEVASGTVSNVSVNSVPDSFGGIDEYTKLALHFNGDVGSTVFTDETGKVVTNNGGVTVSGDESKFGQSIYADGAGTKYLSLADSDDWFLSTGDFTIDFWLMLKSTATTYLFNQYESADRHMQSYVAGGTALVFVYQYDYPKAYAAQSGSVLSVGTWYHIAIVRTSGVIKLFVNGVQQTFNTAWGNPANNFPNISAPLNIISPKTSGAFFLDEFRWSKGIARWTTNFTPPTMQYDDVPPIPVPAVNLKARGTQTAKIWTDGSDSDAIKIDDATGTRVTIEQTTGDTTFTGDLAANNLSGTNTGDQDLTPYAKLDGSDQPFTGSISAPKISSDMGFNINAVIAPANGSITATVAPGGDLTASSEYIYGVYYKTAEGVTKAGQSAHVFTDETNKSFNLTIPVSTDSRVTARVICRTKAGQPYEWRMYELTTINDNTTTTYYDTASDASMTGSPQAGYESLNTTTKFITLNDVKAMTLDSNGTFFGINAGRDTTGSMNTFIGAGAGLKNTTGTLNVALGQLAMGNGVTTGSYNVNLSAYSGWSLTSGYANFFVGIGAGQWQTDGHNNIFIGDYAGQLKADGGQTAHNSECILLGSGTRTSATSSSNEIVIGKAAVGMGSNSVNLGGPEIANTYLHGYVYIQSDSYGSVYGAGNDAIVYYDGTNLILNPKMAGSGYVDVLGTVQSDGYNSADGTAGATADVATLAPDGTTTRTLHFKNGLYTGYTDS